MDIIDFPTETSTHTEKVCYYISTTSGSPQWELNAEGTEWGCTNCWSSGYGFDGETTTEEFLIPEEVLSNTSLVWAYNPLGIFYVNQTPPAPVLVETFPASETYPGSGIWIHSEYYRFTRITEIVQRYERTLRPEVGAAGIIPVIAATLGIVGMMTTGGAGGGKVKL